MLVRDWPLKEGEFIIKWEAENFRQKLVGGKNNYELQNRIAVVTGAGSGLGRSVAIGLARAGAFVALVDIDTKAIEETTVIIKKELPHNSVTGIRLWTLYGLASRYSFLPCSVPSECFGFCMRNRCIKERAKTFYSVNEIVECNS